MLTHQKPVAASSDIFLTWRRPMLHVGGKVASVFKICELPHKKKLYFDIFHTLIIMYMTVV